MAAAGHARSRVSGKALQPAPPRLLQVCTMTTTRREFLNLSLVAAAGAMLSASAASAPAASRRSARAPMKILILGGTNFIGPHMVDAAHARGHSVTVFNRGQTEKRKGALKGEVERLTGDRDPDKGEGLKSLNGKSWDAVIDTSGFVPRIAKASAELLAPNIKQYLFISTLSVYADNATPNQDESAPLGTMADPTVETMGAQFENYGPLKVLCEKAVEKAMGADRTTIVRPGYIVGPGDSTDRFTYWPWRADRGGEMLAPGAPTDPIEYIDGRDLAEFCITLLERGTTGAFNAIGGGGVAGGLTMGRLLEACQKATTNKTTLTWVDADFLEAQGVQGLPIWVPSKGEAAGFHTRKFDKAVAAGMKFRSVDTTVKDTLAWIPSELARRERVGKELVEQAKAEGKEPPKLPDPAKLRAGLEPEQEAAILKAWHEKKS